MKKIKNLGIILSVTTPVLSVVSCGNNDSNEAKTDHKEPKNDSNKQENVSQETKIETIPWTELISQEVAELNEFEKVWGYRPQKPLKAYPGVE